MVKYTNSELNLGGVDVCKIKAWKRDRIFVRAFPGDIGQFCMEEAVFLLLLTKMDEMGFDLKKFRGHPEPFNNYPVAHYQSIKDCSKMVISAYGTVGIGMGYKVYAAVYNTGFVSYWQGTTNFDLKDGECVCFLVDMTQLIEVFHPEVNTIVLNSKKN